MEHLFIYISLSPLVQLLTKSGQEKAKEGQERVCIHLDVSRIKASICSLLPFVPTL